MISWQWTAALTAQGHLWQSQQMFRGLCTAILSLAALALVLFGLCSAVMAYFLPMVFIDMAQPEWFTGAKLLSVGLLATASGVVLWMKAWKPKMPKK